MTPSNDVATRATRNTSPATSTPATATATATAPVASPPTTVPQAVPAALAATALVPTAPVPTAPVGVGIDVAPFDSAQGEDKVVLVACMRELLVLLNAMLRDNLRWDQLKVSAVAKIA